MWSRCHNHKRREGLRYQRRPIFARTVAAGEQQRQRGAPTRGTLGDGLHDLATLTDWVRGHGAPAAEHRFEGVDFRRSE